MKLNKNDAKWDRLNLYFLNENWDIIKGKFDSQDGFLSDVVTANKNFISDARYTLQKAEEVNEQNKNVQNQLNNLIIDSGTSDAEVIQARGDYQTLNERLDSEAVVSKINVYSSKYPKLNDEISDNARLSRAFDDAVEGSTVIISSTESPIYLDNTLIIPKNVNLDCQAKIVYTGERNKSVLQISDSNYTHYYIKGIYDIGSYPTYGGGYHGWENLNYVGFELVNAKNCTVKIEEIIGFSTGFKNKCSAGKGNWFNTIDVAFFTNTRVGIELNSDGVDSWMNSNKFLNSAFSISGVGARSTDKQLYCINQTLTNGNTYGGNSNVFDGLRFETRNDSPTNWTMVYLRKAKGFVFKNYRFEFNNAAKFATIDLASQDPTKTYPTHSIDNIFIPDFVLGNGHYLEFTNIGDIRTSRSEVAKIIPKDPKKYTLYVNSNLVSNYRIIGNNYHTIKGVFRKPINSTSLTEEVPYDYSTKSDLSTSQGLVEFTGSYPYTIYIDNVAEGQEFKVNRLALQSGSGLMLIKAFDNNGTLLGQYDANNKKNIALNGYWNDSNKSFYFNNDSYDTLTVNSSSVKTICIQVTGIMAGMLVESSVNTPIVKASMNNSNLRKNVFLSIIKPTNTTDWNPEEVVYRYNGSSGQEVGWKLTNGAWTSIGTI